MIRFRLSVQVCVVRVKTNRSGVCGYVLELPFGCVWLGFRLTV